MHFRHRQIPQELDQPVARRARRVSDIRARHAARRRERFTEPESGHLREREPAAEVIAGPRRDARLTRVWAGEPVRFARRVRATRAGVLMDHDAIEPELGADQFRRFGHHPREGPVVLVVVRFNANHPRHASALREIQAQRDGHAGLQVLDLVHRADDVVVGALCGVAQINEDPAFMFVGEFREDVGAQPVPDPLDAADECPVHDGDEFHLVDHRDECVEPDDILDPVPGCELDGLGFAEHDLAVVELQRVGAPGRTERDHRFALVNERLIDWIDLVPIVLGCDRADVGDG